jgi:hypothetical protein
MHDLSKQVRQLRQDMLQQQQHAQQQQLHMQRMQELIAEQATQMVALRAALAQHAAVATNKVDATGK